MSPVLSLKGMGKSYGSVKALEHIDLDLYPGEILGLLGDNGAGKSTLVKILSGVIQADSGTMQINGTPVNLKRYTVARARTYGIETVHQDRALGEKQPIWRNFFMGRHLTNSLGMIQITREKQEAMNLLTSFLGLTGKGLSPDAPVSILSGGERQGLAIGRAVYFDSRVVILDEPCTALAIGEVKKVESFIRQLKAQNRSVILVSHNLIQAHDLCDRFVCLDRGKVSYASDKAQTDLETLTLTISGVSHPS